MSVEGSRWTKFRDKVKHAIKEIWKAVVYVLGQKLIGAAISAVGK
jgi:hypothetical protein